MSLISTTPTYNLKVVVQETGIKPDTLRAWERRYGLPNPERTSGGHRLYSQYDIETIKWLMARQEEGLSISRAVKLWFTLEEEGRDPLQAMAYETAEIHPPTPQPDVISALADVRQAWIDVCLQFNELEAERILTQAFAIYPPETVCLEVLQKGLAEVGQRWYENKITAQQEHFISGLTMRRLNTLLATAPAPTRPQRIIVACAPDENHTFAPLLLTLMLRYRGWRALYLGANVPLARLETTIETARPDLILLTAQQLHTAANLLEVTQFLQREEVPTAFGGLIFNHLPALPERIPGYFLGKTLKEGVEQIEHILTANPPLQTAEPVPGSYRKALQIYEEKQAQIETSTWQILQEQEMVYEDFKNANLHMAQDIIAALKLGDIEFLGSQIAWTEKLLVNYNIPVSLLYHYLHAYHQAAKMHLGKAGTPIIEWLAGMSEIDES